MKMSRTGSGIPGLSLGRAEQRSAIGTGSSPNGLPPGLGIGGASPTPRGAGNSINGTTENTGNIQALIGGLLGAGGAKPGRGGGRALEKPSVARANAISRRLGGNPSRGTELKGL